MPRTRPGRLTERCPPWCARRHTGHDHPDDRAHLSEGALVPVVERATAFVDDRLVATTHGTDLIVGLYRRVGEAEAWVHLGDVDGRGIDLSPESARRLSEALVRHLALLAGSDA